MNTIDYAQVPQMFSLCIHDACPLAKQCLRHLAWTALPDTEERVSIINPKCASPSDIAYIRGVLDELGLSDLEFDAYEERYNWAD